MKIYKKRCKIETQLQLKTSKILYVTCRMAQIAVTIKFVVFAIANYEDA